jgi:hypothetical protein
LVRSCLASHGSLLYYTISMQEESAAASLLAHHLEQEVPHLV